MPAAINFEMPLEEVYNMSWPDYLIRLVSFKNKRNWQMQLTREISWEVYRLNFMLTKNRPKSKQEFWDIEGDVKKAREESLDFFQQKLKEYQEKVNG